MVYILSILVIFLIKFYLSAVPMERLSSGTITMLAEMYLACLPFKDYLTWQVLGMHTTMLRRFLRHIIQLTNSMDSTFLRSNELDKSIYGQSYPFLLPFCLTFLHIVDRSPGKCSLGFSCLQSVIGNEVLSNGSAHLGSYEFMLVFEI